MLSTGVGDIDDGVLGGGIPPGSIFLVRARPDVQVEAILSPFLSEHFETTSYLTTVRSPDHIRRTFSLLGEDSEGLIEHPSSPTTIGDGASESATSSTDGGGFPVLEVELSDFVDAVSEQRPHVIVDRVDEFERSEKAFYQNVLQQVQQQLIRHGGVGILVAHTAPSADDRPPLRDITVTMADIVLDIKRVVSGDSVDTYLEIPTNRYHGAPSERFPVELSADGVEIDTSRSIG